MCTPPEQSRRPHGRPPRLPLWGLLAASAVAQEPCLRAFERRDGLPHAQVRCLLQDRRGYLWIGTGGRLCRYDGGEFAACGDEGAAAERTDCMAEGEDGELFLGGYGPRIGHYDPASGPPGAAARFRSLELRGEDLGRNTAALAPDGAGRLWFATETGLFAAAPAGGAALACTPVRPDPRGRWYAALRRDARGRLLYARSDLALRRDGDREQAVALAMGEANVWAVEPLGGDRCLVLGDWHLVEVDFAAQQVARVPVPRRGPQRFTCLRVDRRGHRWIGSTDGLVELPADGAPRRHLEGRWIRALCVDCAGDLWIGTQQGLLCASELPFARLRGGDANGQPDLRGLLPWGDGVLAATDRGLWQVAEDRLQPTAAAARPGLAVGSAVVADRHGDLWFAAPHALLRLRAADLEQPCAEIESFACVPLRLGLDRDGDVLCCTADALLEFARRGEGATTPVRTAVAAPIGAEPHGDGRGRCYCATDEGLLRIDAGGAALLRWNGRTVNAWRLLFDRRGRLWLTLRDRPGLAEVVEQDGESVHLRWIAPAGLPQGIVAHMAEAPDGALWLAFADRLCRFDPDTGRAASWGWPVDGGPALLRDLCVDTQGRVHLAGPDAVLRFTPAALLPRTAPRVLVTALLQAGAPVSLPDGGTTSPPPLTMPAGHGDLVVECCAPGAGRGRVPVQYRLVPVAAEFGAPMPQPTLQFASLAPGDYRLELRAAAHEGAEAGEVTALAVRVLPPWWQSTGFVAASLVLLLLGVVLLHRLRVRRLLAMEAVRRQIATDLHDDLGAGLAQVAVLSEVVKQRAPEPRGLLDEIGALARGMRESLGDIVWSVDPTKDTLEALIDRLRQVATNLFARARLEFRAPAAAQLAAVALPPDRRRHLFLLCKEALANAARHARAGCVTVDFALRGASLQVRIQDDGMGFDAAAPGPGHGQGGMRARAAALGARLEVTSAPGRGTRVELDVPVG